MAERHTHQHAVDRGRAVGLVSPFVMQDCGPVEHILVIAAAGKNVGEHFLVKKQVAGIHEIDIFAGGHTRRLVHGVKYALVRLTDPTGDARRVFTDYIQCTVGRTAVDYYIFHIIISLADNRLDSLLYLFDSVIAHRHDSYLLRCLWLGHIYIVNWGDKINHNSPHFQLQYQKHHITAQ